MSHDHHAENSMNNYALTYAVERLRPDQEDRLLAEGLMLSLQNGLTTVDDYRDAATGLEAAKDGARELQQAGIRVRQLVPDLVTSAEIARRAGVTRQAVSKWPDESGPLDRFPLPYAPTGSGPVWLWGEVNEWLRRKGKEYDSFCQPNRLDHAAFEVWLNSLVHSGSGGDLVGEHHQVIEASRAALVGDLWFKSTPKVEVLRYEPRTTKMAVSRPVGE